jgi:hypothetical protein
LATQPHRRPQKPLRSVWRSDWRWLWIILVLKLMLGVLYVTLVPLWQIHEADFLKVPRIIRDYGRLPIPEDYPEGGFDTLNVNQPPLYYFLLLPIVQVFDDRTSIPPSRQPNAFCNTYNANLSSFAYDDRSASPAAGSNAMTYAARFLNLLLDCGAVVCTYLAARTLFRSSALIPALAAGLIAFEPTLVRLNGIVNNDTLLLFISALHLWFCARLMTSSKNRLWNSAAIIVIAVIAIQSKLHGWVMLAYGLGLIGIVLGRSQRRRLNRRSLRYAALAAAALVVVIGAILFVNQQQYGSIFGRYAWLDETIGQTLRSFSLENTAALTAATFVSTWQDYVGIVNELIPRAVFALVYSLIPAALFAGVILSAVWFAAKRRGDGLAAYALLAGYILVIILLVVFRGLINNQSTAFVNYMTLQAPMRYYMPALPAAAILLAAGAILGLQIVHRRLKTIAFAVPILWLILSGARLIDPIQQALFVQQARLSETQFAALEDVQQPPENLPPNSSFPELLGYRTSARADEGLIDLTLYVRADAPLQNNLMTQINLVDAQGRSQVCRFMPVEGLYSTVRWKPDEVVQLQAEIPNCAVNSAPPFNLALVWLPTSGENIDVQNGSEPIPLTSLTTPLTTAASCHPNSGVIDDSLQVLKLNSPAVASRGSVFVPSVNWLVLEQPERAVTRVYVLEHQQSGQQLLCAGVPRQGSYPFADWSYAETVFFDECILPIPADAETGLYTLSVGVQDQNGEWLPTIDANGQDSGGLIDVGTVEIS